MHGPVGGDCRVTCSLHGQCPKGRYLIGLTGNIATGKSTVAAMLAELGAMVIDADKVAHQVMRQGSEVHERVVAAFGREVIGPDGEIDRGRLGRIVFSAPEALQRLEEIVHPAVGDEVRRRVAQAQTPVVVIEAIKLIEAGMHRMCQALWVTTCSREQQLERLMTERSSSLKEAELRVDTQPPQAQKTGLADRVIDTSSDMDETRRQVQAAWQAIDMGGSHGHDRDISSM
jgi:dephospho-CoA kinase